VKEFGALCRLLGDEARLRLLRVLSLERLNVSELTSILGIAQSGVSRHLGLLKDAGLVSEDREGGFAFYRASPGDRPAWVRDLWSLLGARFEAMAGEPALSADAARLQEVLRQRKESFATHGTEAGQLVPGRSWAAWARALGHLLPEWRVADLGCGEGYLTLETAAWAAEVVAVDRSAEVLARARELARRRGVRNVIWRQGEIEAVPLPDASVDLACLSQALHHAADPAQALAEAVRILVPGGRLLVLDLRAHDQAWVQQRLGDRWLGFSDRELKSLLRDAGLETVRLSVGARLRGDPFTVLVASAVKPASGATRRSRRTRVREPKRAA